MANKCDCGAEFHEEPAHKLSCASLATKCDKCGALLGINFGGSPLAHFDDCPTLSPTPNAAGTATPRPWRLAAQDPLRQYIIGPDYPGMGVIGEVNLMRQNLQGIPDGHANAALICEAVNHYEAVKGERDKFRDALRRIASGEAFEAGGELSCEFESDARYTYPKREAHVIEVAREALKGDSK